MYGKEYKMIRILYNKVKGIEEKFCNHVKDKDVETRIGE
jgi:hypothetical protein